MLVLLSPSKKLELETPVPEFAQNATRCSHFRGKIHQLVERMQFYDAKSLQKLMGVSEKIAMLNVERYQVFHHTDARVAIYTFSGDTYAGFDASSLVAQDFAFAHRHVRILSGLYGIIKPGDLIKPYRLEMGTVFGKNDDLYGFWQQEITHYLQEELQQQKSNVVVNLASREYASVVDRNHLKKSGVEIIDFVFKDKAQSGMKVIGLLAKKARGLFARAIVDRRINATDTLVGLQRDAIGGYVYSTVDSTQNQWVFLRESL